MRGCLAFAELWLGFSFRFSLRSGCSGLRLGQNLVRLGLAIASAVVATAVADVHSFGTIKPNMTNHLANVKRTAKPTLKRHYV